MSVEITNVKEAYQASYKAEGIARLIERGLGNWTYQTEEQRAVASSMDVLLEYIIALGAWLDGESCKTVGEKKPAAVANKVVRRKVKP